MSKKTALVVLASCAIVLFAIVGAAVFLNGRENARLRAAGVPVAATVLDKTSRVVGWSSQRGDDVRRCVALQFRTTRNEAALGSACDGVWQEDWDPLRVGDTIDAIYLPGSVHQNADGTYSATVYLARSLAR